MVTMALHTVAWPSQKKPDLTGSFSYHCLFFSNPAAHPQVGRDDALKDREPREPGVHEEVHKRIGDGAVDRPHPHEGDNGLAGEKVVDLLHPPGLRWPREAPPHVEEELRTEGAEEGAEVGGEFVQRVGRGEGRKVSLHTTWGREVLDQREDGGDHCRAVHQSLHGLRGLGRGSRGANIKIEESMRRKRVGKRQESGDRVRVRITEEEGVRSGHGQATMTRGRTLRNTEGACHCR